MKLPEYKEHKERNLRISSAIKAAKAIVVLEILKQHKKELLSVCIWKITEADGFYKERYISFGGLSTNNRKSLQHEHVYQRKYLIEQIINNPEKTEELLNKAVGCAVTENEHKILTKTSKENPDLVGWDRYRVANIRVFDLAERKELDLEILK